MSSVISSVKILSPILDVVVVILGVAEVITGHLVEGGALTAAGMSLLVKDEAAAQV